MLKLKVSFKSKPFLKAAEGPKMKIGELAVRANVKASAIRYYEKIGVLEAPHRIGGQRRYPIDALHRVLLIRFASEMDLTLAEIKIFLAGLHHAAPVGPRWKRFAHAKIQQVDNSIKRSRLLKSLLQHLLRCHCPSLRVCVQRLSLSPKMKKISARN